MPIEFSAESPRNERVYKGNEKFLYDLLKQLSPEQIVEGSNGLAFNETLEKLGLEVSEIMAFGIPPFEMAVAENREEVRERTVKEAVIIGKIEGILQQKLGKQMSVSSKYIDDKLARGPAKTVGDYNKSAIEK